jgi:uncharacterized repeat protein (TIGR01451 family)/fimbrial isopeptide formation D2 family protein
MILTMMIKTPRARSTLGEAALTVNPSLANAGRQAARALAAACALLCATVGTVAIAQTPVAAPPATLPGSQFAGENFTTQTCFSNSAATVGYQPVIQVILRGGLTLSGADYAGAAVAPELVSTGAGTFINPVNGLSVTLLAGERLYNVRYPLGSVSSAQPPQCINLNVFIPLTATLGTALNIGITPIFAFGSSPLDTGPAAAITGVAIIVPVTPSVVKITKKFITPELETATGPSYPRQYELVINAATGATISPLTISDVLPTSMQFVSYSVTAGSCPTATATPSTTTPGGTLTLNCGSLTGAATATDIRVLVNYYVPKCSAGSDASVGNCAAATVLPANGAATLVSNTGTLTGTYNTGAVSGTSTDTFTAKSQTIRKSVAVTTDTGPTGVSPGDELTYTLVGEISDYFQFNSIVLTDNIGDGQTYKPGSFTFSFNNNTNLGASQLGAATVPADGINFLIGAKVAGVTPITLDVSAHKAFAYAGADSVMRGARSFGATPIGIASNYTLTYKTIVDRSYGGTVAGGTQLLSTGDKIVNNVTSTAKVGSVVGSGASVTDTSATSLSVVGGQLTKSLAFVNGVATIPTLVKPGDVLTYKLNYTIPAGTYEDLKIDDFLPLPVLTSPTLTTPALVSAGGANANCVSGINPPVSGAWCFTSATNLPTSAPDCLGGATMVTTAGSNGIRWDFPTCEPIIVPSNRVVEILFSVSINNSPIADGLNLTNLAQASLNDSNKVSATSTSIVQIKIAEPVLSIKKTIVQSSNTTSGCPTAAPVLVTVGVATCDKTDAGDTITYRLRVENKGNAPAFDVRLTDDLGLGAYASCTVVTVQNLSGLTVATTGALTIASPLVITPGIPSNANGALDPAEVLLVDYACTVPITQNPRIGNKIDNIARIANYSNAVTGTNFATNLTVGGPNASTASVTLKGIESIAKTLVWTSLATSTSEGNNAILNPGEQVQFKIRVVLNEGTYVNFAIVDNKSTIPALSACATVANVTPAAVGATATPTACQISNNVTIVGTTLTCAPTLGTAACIVELLSTPQAPLTGDTNTATVSATNQTSQTSQQSWTIDPPDPAVSKTIVPNTGVDAGNSVVIRLRWDNGDLNNPMFQCKVTDNLNFTGTNPITPSAANPLFSSFALTVPSPLPAGYTCAVSAGVLTCTNTTATLSDYSCSIAAGVVTCAATDLNKPCAPSPAFADITAVVDSTAITGTTYTNKLTLESYPLPQNLGSGTLSTLSNTATLALTATTGAAKTLVTTSNPDTVGNNVSVGETATFDLSFTFPEGVSRAVTISDVISAGGLANFRCVSAAQSSNGSFCGAQLRRVTNNISASTDPGAINASIAGTAVNVTAVETLGTNTVSVALGDVTVAATSTSNTASYVLRLELQVQNTAANQNATAITDRATVSYANGAGTVVSLTGATQTVTIVEPKIIVTKAATPTAPQAGDTVSYSITVKNDVARLTPAYDVVVCDAFPSRLGAFSVVTYAVTTPIGTASVASTPFTIATGQCGATGTNVALRGVIDKLDPGELVTLTFTAQVSATTPLGSIIVNTTSAQASSLPGGIAGDIASTTGAGTTNERTGPSNDVDFNASAASTVTTTGLNIDKSRVSTPAVYAIGDTVRYQIKVGVPKGVANNVQIQDLLPTGLRYVGNPTYVIPLGITAVPTSPTVSTSAIAPQVTWTFTSLTTATAGDILIEFDAVVENILSNQLPTSRANAARVVSDNPAGGSLTANSPTQPAITVGEPNIALAKNIISNVTNLEPGAVVSYEVLVSNANLAATTPAYRLTLADTLPALMASPSAYVLSVVAGSGPVACPSGACLTGTTTAVATADVATTVGGWSLSNAGNGIDLYPGVQIKITFQAVVDASAINTATIGGNAVEALYSSQKSATNTDARTGTTGVGDDDVDTTLNNYRETVTSAGFTLKSNVAIAKTLLAPASGNVVIGSTVTYKFKIDLSEGTTQNVILTDVLPPDLTYLAHRSSAGSGCTAFTNPARTGSGQNVTLNFGNVVCPSDANFADDFIEIEIDARVNNVLANQAARTLTNGGSNSGDTASGTNAFVTTGTTPVRVDVDTNGTTAGLQGVVITIAEPALIVTKSANPATQSVGDEVVFTIDVAHAASCLVPAYDIVLTDTLPANMTFVSSTPAMSGSGPYTLSIASLACGATQQVLVRAQIAIATPLPSTLTNTASLTWKSLPGAAGTATDGRTGQDGVGGLNDYTTSTTAPVNVIDRRILDATKTVAIVAATDTTNPGVLDAGEQIEYTIVIKNTDAAITTTSTVFTDAIPANTTFVAGSITSVDNVGASYGTPSFAANTVTVAIGAMAPSTSLLPSRIVTIKFKVSINAGTPSGTLIRNQGAVDSAQTVTEPTDQDGIDSNGDQPTDIYVGGAPATSQPLYATKAVQRVIDADATSSTTVGDTMEYTFTVQNNSGAAISAVTLTDAWPAGLTYVASSATPAALGVTAATRSVNWPIGTLAAGQTVTGTIRVLVSNLAAVTPAGTYVNQGTVTGTSATNQPISTLTDGNGVPSDGNQPTTFTATATGTAGTASIDVQKRWTLLIDANNNGVVNPGDTIAYQISVTNTGNAAANNVVVNDTPLPTQITALPTTVATSLGAVTVATASAVSVNLGTLPAGQTATITFNATVNAATGGQTAANQAIAAATNVSGTVLSDDNGDATDGRGPTLTPIFDGAPANAFPTVTKAIVTTSEAASGGNTVLIGEVVTYAVTITVPAGTSNNVSIVDTLPVGMSFVAGSATLTPVFNTALNSSVNPAAINAAASGSAITLPASTVVLGISGSNPTVTVPLGVVINSDNDANAESYTLTYKALVQNVAANVAGSVLTNAGTVSFNNQLNQAVTLTAVTTSVTVNEPALVVDKQSNVGSLLSSGGTVRYTFVVTNPTGAGNRATAFDVKLKDVLPSPFTSYSVVSFSGGIAGPSQVTGIANVGSGTTVEFNAAVFPPDGTLTVVIDAVATGPITSGSTVNNSSTVTWTSLPGTNGTASATPGAAGSATGERTSTAGGTPNTYVATDTNSIRVGTPSIVKSVLNARTNYAVGEEVEYQLVVSYPPVNLANNKVVDTLPAGLVYVAGSLAVVAAPNLTNSAATATVGAGGAVTFDLGAVANPDAVVRTVTLTYKARVANILGNQSSTALANSAVLSYTDPTNNTTQSATAVAQTIRVGEPVIALAKTVVTAPVPLIAGSTVRYQVSVTNTGNTPAYEQIITDTLPATLSGISNVVITPSFAAASALYGASTAPTVPAGNITAAGFTSTSFQLNPADSVIIAFDVVVQNNIIPGQTLTNGASATFSSLPGANANERDGSTGGSTQTDGNLNNYNTSATVDLTAGTSITLAKSFSSTSGVTASASAYAIGETISYRLRVALAPGTYNNVIVNDTLPAGLVYQSFTLTLGNGGITPANAAGITLTQTGQALRFALGSVVNPANAVSTDDFLDINVTAVVANVVGNQSTPVAGNTRTNAASLTQTPASGIPAAGATQSVTATLVEPNLTQTKTALPLAPSLGDEVTYTVRVAHSAASTANAYAVVVKDLLPTNLTYVPGSASLTPDAVSAGQNLQWTLPSLTLATGFTDITYRARVATVATIGAPLTNSAALAYQSLTGTPSATNNIRDGSQGSAGPLNDYVGSATAPVTPQLNTFLDANKSVAIVVDGGVAGQLDSGDTLEYTIALTNTSATVTATNVVFTDPIPANTTFVAGTLSSTQGTVNAAGNPLSVAVGSLTPGQTVTVKFRVTLNAGTASGTVISNQGSVDSDQTTPRPTDSDGNPSNGTQPTDITVGPVATQNALSAAKTVARQIDAAPAAAANGAGDTMRYTIVLKNNGTSALTNVGFVDQIPSGLTYVAGSAAPAGIGGGTLSEAGGIITLTGASLPVGASITFSFDVTINAFAGASVDYTNQGTATSAQTQPTRTDGNSNPADGNQPTVFTATAAGTPTTTPVLDLQKRATLVTDVNGNGIVNPGDRISYSITIKNTGGASATNVRLTDALPTAQLSYIGPLNLSQGIAVTSGPSLIDVNIGTLAPNATATVSFVMEAVLGSSGQVATNQASATSTEISTPVRSDNNGNSADGINPTLTPIEDPANPGSASPAGLTKSIIASSEAASTGTTVLIGEIVTYQVAVNLPAGVTRNASIVDTLPGGMSYVSGSATLARAFDGAGITASGNPAGINAAGSTVPVALNDAVHVIRAGQTVTVPLGDVTNSESDANAESYTLTYKALVQNVNSNNAGTALTNSATLTYTNALSQPSALAPQTTTVTVTEPALTTVKSVNTGTLLATGGTVTYTVVVSNLAAANRATAFDVVVRDTLPPRVTAVSAVSCVGSSAAVVVAATLSTLPTVGCDVSSFAVGESLTLTYTATYSGTLPTALAVGELLPNSATTTYTSLPGTNGTSGATPGTPGSDTGERTGAGTGPNDLTSTGSANIVIGEVTLNKSVVNPKAFYAIGDEVSYQVVVSIPGNINAVTALDTLGVGLGYVAGSLVIAPQTGLSFTPAPASDFAISGQSLTLRLGAANVGATPVVKTVTLTYKAKVQNIVGNWSGANLANAASVEYTNPGAPTVTLSTASDSKSVTVGEPVIMLAKAIVSAPTPVDAGTVITYDVTVQNTGTTTGFETVVTDTLPATLSNAVVSAITPNFTNGSPATPTVNVTATGWATSAFALNAGDSVVIRFTAVVGSNVQPGQSIVNAVAATFSSQPGTVAGERTGSDGVLQSDRTVPNNYNATTTAPAITAINPVTLTKSLLPGAATRYAIGETVTYRLRLALLEGTVPNVVLTDALPSGLSVVSATLSTGNTGVTTSTAFAPPAVGSSGSLTFSLGTVTNPANGSTADDFLLIDITAKVDNALANQDGTSLSNTATLDYNAATGPVATVTTSPVVVTVKEPVVQLLKTASLAAVSLGDEVTFTLTLDHTAASSADAFNLVVTDTLPAGLSYSAGSATPAPVSVSGQVVTWNIGSLTLAQDQTTISYKARVALTAPIGAPLTNAAALTYQSTSTGTTGRTGSDGAGGLNDYVGAASVPVTPSDIRTLTASKTVALVTDADASGNLTAGDTLEYTIVLTNRAASNQTNVVFTDAIPANTVYVAATLTSTQGVVNDTGAPLSVAVGTMLPNAVVTVKFRVRVTPGAAPTTVIRNQGSVDSDQIVPTRTDDPTQAGAFDPTDIVVNGLPPGPANPQLTVLKSVALAADPVAPTGTINVGDSVTFTITVQNSGNVAQTNVALTDVVPVQFTVTATSANASFLGNTVTANLGALPVGTTATVTVTALTTAAGAFTNQASVVSQQITTPTLSDGDSITPGAQPTPITVLPATTAGAPLLAVAKTVAIGIDSNLDGRLNPGESLRYVITVRNTGTAAAANVVVTDTLPAGLTLVDVIAGQGAVVSGTSSNIVVNVGIVGIGASVQITVNAGVPSTTAVNTRLTNTASATATGLPTVSSPPADIVVEAAPLLPPPTGQKTGFDRGYPNIQWRQVWINSASATALKIRVVDPLAANQVFVAGSLVCTPKGSSVVISCLFDSATQRVVVEALVGGDLGNTTEATAANEVIVTFNVAATPGSSLVTFTNTSGAFWDRNGNGNIDDDIFFGQTPIAAAASVTPAREIPTLRAGASLALILALLLLAGYRLQGHSLRALRKHA